MQRRSFLVVEVVPVVGDLERHHRALGQVGGLVELEAAVLDAGFQRGHAVKIAPAAPSRTTPPGPTPQRPGLWRDQPGRRSEWGGRELPCAALANVPPCCAV